MRLKNKEINTIAVVAYYITALTIGMLSDNVVLTALFYAIFIGGAVFKIAETRLLNGLMLIVSCGGLACGIVGLLVNGNIQILNFTYMAFGIWIAMMIMDSRIDNRIFMYLCYSTALVIAGIILKKGLSPSGNFFVESSVNYISVFLMLSLCVYYARADLYNKRYSLIPAGVSLVLSFVAGGRGGFLSIAILFFPLFLIKFYEKKRGLKEKTIMTIFLLMMIIIVAYPLFLKILSSDSNYALIENFKNKANLKNSYRYFCWQEYVDSCKNNWEYLLFGAKLEGLKWVDTLYGNLHNSFLFTHAYYGILGFAFVIIQSLKSGLFSIRNKKWVYMFSLLSFEVRSFTDHVFAANRITPIFLALLLAPEMLGLAKKYDLDNSSAGESLADLSVKINS